MSGQRQSAASKRLWGWDLGSGGGGVTNGANVGAGQGQSFRDKIAGVLNFRTVLAGAGVTVSTVGNVIQIDQNENVDGGAPGNVYTPFQHIDGGGA